MLQFPLTWRSVSLLRWCQGGALAENVSARQVPGVEDTVQDGAGRQASNRSFSGLQRGVKVDSVFSGWLRWAAPGHGRRTGASHAMWLW